MKAVIIEHPYRNADPVAFKENIQYARACMFDSLGRDEAPFSSALMYGQCLVEEIPEQRSLGITAGLEWGIFAEETVVYSDHGITEGMLEGIRAAKKVLRPVTYRFMRPHSQTQIEEVAQTIADCEPSVVLQIILPKHMHNRLMNRCKPGLTLSQVITGHLNDGLRVYDAQKK